nr:hypothetical protein CFP56_78741 [Quercus suber]
MAMAGATCTIKMAQSIRIHTRARRAIALQTSVATVEFSECGRLKPEVAPPCEIRVDPNHVPWQHKGYKIHRSMEGIVIDMIKERVGRGTLEPCHSANRNLWFIVHKKEANKYRLINAAIEMNRVTLRDATLLPSTDEFSEDFAGC